jgi:RNA polymerase-binding transcription factor DksA
MERRYASAREALLARRREVLERYRGALARVEEELDTREIEAIDNASELWDARLLGLLGEAERRHIAEIDSALARIEDEQYGTCIECAEPIEGERLEALPEAARCLGCALAQVA